MKIVVNCCYGGFGLSVEVVVKMFNEFGKDEDIDRIDIDLIVFIEKKGFKFVSGCCVDFEVVEIFNVVIDWEINEYDGFEEIIVVVNGKIKHF